MEILNLVLTALIVPLALTRFRQKQLWFLFLLLWWATSVYTSGFFTSVSLVLGLLVLYVALVSLGEAALLESGYLVHSIEAGRLRKILGGAMLRWSIFPVLALLGYFSYQAINQSMVGLVHQAAYSLSLGATPPHYACGADGRLICECTQRHTVKAHSGLTASDCPEARDAAGRPMHASGLERDLHFTIDRVFKQIEEDLRNQVKTTLDRGGSTTEAGFDAMQRLLFDGDASEVAFKPNLHHLLPALTLPPCDGVLDRLFKLRDCIRREIFSQINGLYSKINAYYVAERADLRASFVSFRRRVNQASHAEGKNLEQWVDNYIVTELDRRREKYHADISSLFETIRLVDLVWYLTWLGMVFLAGALGFFYIVCRFAYDPRNGNASLKLLSRSHHRSTVTSEALIREMSQTGLNIDLDGQTWYVSETGHVELDSREDFTLPQPTRLFFRRFPGRLWMRRYSPETGCTGIGLNFMGGTQVIRVGLKEHDRLVFRLSNLLAFTETISLGTHFSWKLAYLLNRSPFFCSVTGPGELLLTTKWRNAPSRAAENSQQQGEQEHGDPARRGNKANPRDIALLDLHGSYALNVSQSILNVYWDDHSVEAQNGSIILRDQELNAGGVNRAAGFLRKMLLVPVPVVSGVFLLPLLMGWLL